jgi:SAM-dependent methyltransferase
MALATEAIRERVGQRDQWYHTLDLAPGVVTPGWFDLRSVAPQVLPHSLAGKRCLDVGTFDGFWAFEMERRGAAEVLAVDIVDPRAWDWPVTSGDALVSILEDRKQGGAGFEIAAAALGSDVRYAESSVYDLDIAVHGSFDFVFMGSLLLHLRDPIRALERLRAVCRPDGTVCTMDAIDPTLSRLFPRKALAGFDGEGRPWWWLPNLAGYERMVRAAGLVPLGAPTPVRLPVGGGHPEIKVSKDVLRHREGRRLLAAARKGDPQAWIHSRPAPDPCVPSRPTLVPLKLRTIDAAFALDEVTSVADLGGVWAVDAGYSFHALEHHAPARAVLVDDDITPRVRERAAAFGQLELLEQNFGLERTPGDVGPIGVVLLFDVLLHQVDPDWDEILHRYAPHAQAFAIVNPMWSPREGGETGTVRLLDLGEARYRQAVPPQDNLEGLFGRLDEINPQRGRPWRDVHDVWQWGITDADLRAKLDALGFEVAFSERHGRWRGLEDFEDCAYVFRRRA